MISVKYMQDVFNFTLDIIDRKCTKDIIVHDFTGMLGFYYKNVIMCFVVYEPSSFTFKDKFIKTISCEYGIVDSSGVRYKNEILNGFEEFSEQDLFSYSTVMSSDDILSLYLCTALKKIQNEKKYFLSVPLIHEYFKDNILCTN